MNATELLERIARTLRDDVAPSVTGEYAKTQTFMAAVVLQKLSRELALGDAHRAANEADLRDLSHDLRASIESRALPAGVAAAFASFAAEPNDTTLSRLVESLWSARDVLGVATFDALLHRVRRTLRAQIDRRLESAT